jgi:hypothetical protein
MKEALKLALEALKNNRQTHYSCEDDWYQCPKHEDRCFNDYEGDECNCGADSANLEIDAAIKALEEALAKQEQSEPVAFASHGVVNWIADKQFQHEADLYATPQQRTWVGLTDEDKASCVQATAKRGSTYELISAIEAKLKEKNT